MATLSKVVDGNILYDTFEYGISPNWSIMTDLPERVAAQYIGGARLRHGETRVSMLISPPVGDFVFQAKLLHQPKSLADVGGVLIQSDSDNRVECQTYFNGIAGPDQYYERIKVVRRDDRYSIYAAKSDYWEPIGATEIPDCHQIGFFLDGPVSEQSEDLIIESVAMFKANYVTFIDVPHNQVIRIRDKDGNVIAEKQSNATQNTNKTLIDLSQKMMPFLGASIEIMDEGSITTKVDDVDIYGGDVFVVNYDVMLMIDGKEVNTIEEQDIGTVDIGGTELALTLVNKDRVEMSGRKLRVVKYSEMFRGEKLAEVALVSNGVTGEFKDYADIPTLLPNESADFRLKVTRDKSSDAPFFVNKYKFKIILE